MSTDEEARNTPRLPSGQRYSWSNIGRIWRRRVIDFPGVPPISSRTENVLDGILQRMLPGQHRPDFIETRAFIQDFHDVAWISVYARATPPNWVPSNAWYARQAALSYKVDESDSDCSEGGEEHQKCLLCTRRVSNVELVGCTHKLCTSCLKSIYWSRCVSKHHWPESFPCPWCRHDVMKVRVLAGREIDKVPSYMLYVSECARQRLNNAKLYKITPHHMREWALESCMEFSFPKHRHRFSWN